MWSFLKRFWAAALSLAALAGFYLAALAVDLVWVFWVGVAVAAAWALVTSVGPKAVSYFNRLRLYPKLLETAGQLETKNQKLSDQVRRLTDDLSTTWTRGVDEGNKQIMGGLLAKASSEIPKLIGVDLSADGGVLLLASSSEGAVGARYRIEVNATGANRGTVEVVALDLEEGRATLACMETSVPQFWQHLAERVAFDSRPPEDVTLVPEMRPIEAQQNRLRLDRAPRSSGQDG